MAGQLLTFLDETDYMDTFQFGFRLRFGMKLALVVLAI